MRENLELWFSNDLYSASELMQTQVKTVTILKHLGYSTASHLFEWDLRVHHPEPPIGRSV